MRRPTNRSVQAREAEDKVNRTESIRLWTLDFGEEFPTHGDPRLREAGVKRGVWKLTRSRRPNRLPQNLAPISHHARE
jgi:hypothetical protein